MQHYIVVGKYSFYLMLMLLQNYFTDENLVLSNIMEIRRINTGS